MEYRISRASDYNYGKNSPCKQAVCTGKDKYYYNIWTIKIDTLADINALIGEVGKIVIYPSNEIIIYDDYIE